MWKHDRKQLLPWILTGSFNPPKAVNGETTHTAISLEKLLRTINLLSRHPLKAHLIVKRTKHQTTFSICAPLVSPAVCELSVLFDPKDIPIPFLGSGCWQPLESPRDLPGSPAVKIPCFQYRGHGFNP